MRRRIPFSFTVVLLVASLGWPLSAQSPDSEPARDNILSRIESSLALTAFEEDFNPFNGQFVLRLELVDLPGHGGLDLKVNATYSSEVWNRTDFSIQTHTASLDPTDHLGGGGWQLHMGKVIRPNGGGSPNPTAPNNPLLVMPDGSTRMLYVSATQPGELTSENRWRYKFDTSSSTWKLTTTNGTVWEFATVDSAGSTTMRGDLIAQCIRITDVHGNRIDIEYTGVGLIDKIEDTYGRKVEFVYHSNTDRIRYLRVKNGSTTLQQWELRYSSSPQLSWVHPLGTRTVYSLNEIVPPAGASWRFDYHSSSTALASGRYQLERVTTPLGGKIDYTYTGEEFQVGCQSGFPIQRPVLDRRVTSGRGVSSGTWTYSYSNPGTQGAKTTVTGPSGYWEIHDFQGWGPYVISDPNLWKIGKPVRRIVDDGLQTTTTEYSWIEDELLSSDYRLSSGWFNCGSTRQWAGIKSVRPTEVTRSVERDGRTYVTTQKSFDVYGNPRLIDESGEVSRQTTLDYWYSQSLNILNGRVTWSQQTPGERERSWYTSKGLLERQNHNPSSSTSTDGIDTQFTYDSSADLTKRFTENGSVDRETRHKNYSFGLPERDEIELSGSDIWVNRDVGPLGLIDWEEDGRQGSSYRTYFDYDALGRLTEIDPPAGYDTVFSYASDGSKVWVTRGSGSDAHVVEYSFDGFGRLTQWHDLMRADRRVVTYDALGRKVREQLYLGSLTGDRRDFDVVGRLTRVEHPDGTRVAFTFDQGKVYAWDELNRLTVQEFEAFGDPDERRLAELWDADDNQWQYIYSSSKNRLLRIDAPIHTADREFAYTSKHFLDEEDHPETGLIEYTYSPAGDRIKRKKGGLSVEYDYDRAGRLIDVDPSGSSHDVEIDYNDAGLRTLVANSAATTELDYDGSQRLRDMSTWLGGKRYDVELTYDSHDRLVEIRYPSGREVKYQYNDESRVRRIYDGAGGTDYAPTITYRAHGAVDDLTLGNGVTISYGYDSRFRPTSLTASAGKSLTLTYDSTSNIKSWNDGSVSRSFSYDDLDRLKSATGPGGESIGYSYTSVGNRTGRTVDGVPETYNYNSSHRLTSVSGGLTASYSYDGAGRLTLSSGTIYTYSPLDTLIASTAGSGVSFGYGGDGRMVSRTAGGKTTYFVRDAEGKILAEYDSAGALLREHIYYYGRRIATREAGGDRRHFAHDPLGSVWLVLDGAGSAEKTYAYYPFGTSWVEIKEEALFADGFESGDVSAWSCVSSTENCDNVDDPRDDEDSTLDPRFTGKEYDRALGFYDFEARRLDPRIGRFVLPDPGNFDLSSPQTYNRYAYAANNPYKYVDPHGRVVDYVLDAAGIAYDIQEIRTEGASFKTVGILVLDVALAVAPVVPTIGGVKLAAKGAAAVPPGLLGKAWARGRKWVQGARGVDDAGSGAARFVANAGGETQIFLRGAEETLEVSSHAARRITERGLTLDAVEAVISDQKSFQYFHNGAWKTGYYDPVSKVFVGATNDTITTVINDVGPSYINNLLAVTP